MAISSNKLISQPIFFHLLVTYTTLLILFRNLGMSFANFSNCGLVRCILFTPNVARLKFMDCILCWLIKVVFKHQHRHLNQKWNTQETLLPKISFQLSTTNCMSTLSDSLELCKRRGSWMWRSRDHYYTITIKGIPKHYLSAK